MKFRYLLLLVLPTLIYTNSYSQENFKWDYPIKIGTEAWADLKNNSEKVEACQIPQEFLENIKTKDLIELVLAYPLLPDIFAFNDIKDGLDKFESDFNGFRALVSRQDCGKELLKFYKSQSPSHVYSKKTSVDKLYFSISFSVMELSIAHQDVTKKLDSKLKKEIVKSLNDKRKEKAKHKDWYIRDSKRTNDYSILKIIEGDGNKYDSFFEGIGAPEDMLKTTKTLKADQDSLIIEMINDYIREQ